LFLEYQFHSTFTLSFPLDGNPSYVFMDIRHQEARSVRIHLIFGHLVSEIRSCPGGFVLLFRTFQEFLIGRSPLNYIWGWWIDADRFEDSLN